MFFIEISHNERSRSTNESFIYFFSYYINVVCSISSAYFNWWDHNHSSRPSDKSLKKNIKDISCFNCCEFVRVNVEFMVAVVGRILKYSYRNRFVVFRGLFWPSSCLCLFCVCGSFYCRNISSILQCKVLFILFYDLNIDFFTIFLRWRAHRDDHSIEKRSIESYQLL